MVVAFVVAFQRFYIIGPSKYVGWGNFSSLFGDTLTGIVFRNTFYYTALALALVFAVPIVVSILIMEMKKSVIRIMMLLWFLPVSSMAGLMIWKWWYDPQWGLFNSVLGVLGLPALRWLNDSGIAMLCLVLPGLIMFAPGLIYIASLQSIPAELYEAAELEGTGLWQKIWYVTLPRLRPVIAMMMLLSIIRNMQVFNQPMVLTGGGPGYATLTVVLRIYKLSFVNMNFGKGTALALVLFLILGILIYIQRKYFAEDINK